MTSARHAMYNVQPADYQSRSRYLDLACSQIQSQLFFYSYQHCVEQQFQTLMCILHNFSSIKARFCHTSTVTRLHSCSGKKYAYALRASCFYIEINIFEHF